jgi:hypothetical protein
MTNYDLKLEIEEGFDFLLQLQEHGLDVFSGVIEEVAFSNGLGPVRYDVHIKESSVGNFDGILQLSFTNLTNRSIFRQEGTVVVQIVGNIVIPVNGTGHLYYLEFDNGSFYRFSETSGLTVFDLSENGLDATWQLNGSSDGSQWANSNFQYPKNLVEGFWVSNLEDGIKYPYNVGGDKLFVRSYNAIVESENIFDRNPMNAPALFKAGVIQNENINYESIKLDNSKFYDDFENRRIFSSLVYEDFVEPISGSVANFNGDVYGLIPYNPEYEISNFGLEFDIDTGDYTEISSAASMIFAIGGNFAAKKGIHAQFFEPAKTLRIFYYSDFESPLTPLFDFEHNTRYHYKLLRYSGIGTVLYINGEQVPFTALDSNPSWGQYDTVIGNGSDNGTPYYNNQRFNGKFYSFKFYSIDSQFETENMLIDLRFSEEGGEHFYNVSGVGDSPHAVVSLAGSSVEDLWLLKENKNSDHNFRHGYKNESSGGKIPGDPNNFGFDVLGNPIDNLDQVKKYNRILKYLRR